MTNSTSTSSRLSTSDDSVSTAAPQLAVLRPVGKVWKLRVRTPGCPSLGTWCRYFIAKAVYESWSEIDKDQVFDLTFRIKRHPELSGYLHYLEWLLTLESTNGLKLAIDFLSPSAYFGMRFSNPNSFWKVQSEARLGPNPIRRRGYNDHGNYVEHHRKTVDSDWKILSGSHLVEYIPSEIFGSGWISEAKYQSYTPGDEVQRTTPLSCIKVLKTAKK
jgi:hypothetical protein